MIEIPATLAGIKSAIDLVKALAPSDAAMYEVRRHLMDAQEAITEQRNEIRRLEDELADIRRFKEEDRVRFKRSTAAGLIDDVPCYKEIDGDGTPYCANCFENFKRSILYRSRVADSRMFSYSCFNCGLKVDRV